MFSSSSPRTAPCTSSAGWWMGLPCRCHWIPALSSAASFRQRPISWPRALRPGRIDRGPGARRRVGGGRPIDFQRARTVAGGPAAAAGPSRPGTQVGGLSPFPGARPHARIRVDAAQLDDLVGLAGELAVLSDNLMGLREISGLEPWLHALEALQRVSRQIRDTTLDLRMVPVDELFSRFPRVVRDLADRSGKEIELRIVGQETRLDRTIVERLSDPMVHLIRNAVDHALETPQERLEKGKPRMGRITLFAGHEGDRVAIRVEDDGRGLDREKIVKKGMARGDPAGDSPDDPRVVSLIFEPGFSTRDTVSELSGRGVGLDVVRDAVRGLRGSVAVESTPGKGTAFIFRLPLTLALIDGLLVETAGGQYVVPLAQVEECVALNGTSRPWPRTGPAWRSGASWCRWSRCEPVPGRRPLARAARIAVDPARRPAGRRRRRPAAGPRPGGHPVAGRGPARPQPIFRSHHPGRWLRVPDPRSIGPGVRIARRRS